MATAVAALIERIPGCTHLPAQAVGALSAAARLADFPRGARLVDEGQPVPDWFGVIDHGAVEVSRAAGGASEVLDRLGAGDVLDPGTPGLPAAWSVVAVEPTQALLLSQSAVARHRGSLRLGPATDYRGEVALFTRAVGQLVKRAPVTCAPGVSVTEAARLMTAEGVGSVAVVDQDGAPVGVVTDRDLRARVVADGLPPTTAVATVMSAPVVGVAPECPAVDALLEMTRRGIHHLAVVAGGRLTGVVSSHDIMLLQGAHPVGLIRQIDTEASLEGLAALAPRTEVVVRWLAEQGASAFDVARIVAEVNDRLVDRALGLILAQLEREEGSRPPVSFSWLAAGSEGRREQTLKTDQDNALLYADPPGQLEAEASRYFHKLGTAMGDALARLGFPPCDGGFMAANPRWCQPESVWRRYFRSWMDNPRPEDVTTASLFFDVRAVAGDRALGDRLSAWATEEAATAALFQRHMARAALERSVPLGIFGGFVVDRAGAHRGTLDLKARGVFPMTQGMRACALSEGLRETNTVVRLLELGERGMFARSEVEELRDAYEVVCRVRLNHQLSCLDAGRPADNFIDPERLRPADRVLLKQAFKSLAWLGRFIQDRFHTELLG